MKEDLFVERLVTLTLEVDGGVVIIENVPALVSEDSGERHFSPATVRHVEDVLRGERKPSRIVGRHARLRFCCLTSHPQPNPADIQHMARFWIWGVRNPVLLLAAIAAAAGLLGVADDAIAFTALLGFGIIADAATHLGRRARAREQRALAVALALREATAVRERLQQRRAA